MKIKMLLFIVLAATAAASPTWTVKQAEISGKV